MRVGRRFLLVTCYLLLVTLGGCGYTTHPLITNTFKTIHVEPFVNKIDITKEIYASAKYRIYRPSLESDITRVVTDKYLSDGNLRPSPEATADLFLKGEVTEFRRDPLRYDNSNNVTEYRINLIVNISLWDKKENKLLWQEINFTGNTTYFTTGSLAKTEDSAVNDALADLARRIVELTVEQW